MVGELGGSSLFGARFRENAARALLIPRRRPGQRTPLWQQRLRAQSLLAVARALRLVPDRARDLSRAAADDFDLRALRDLLAGLRDGSRAARRRRDRRRASPFAALARFEYVAQYLYEDDAPAAERRVAALTLDRDLLRELLGADELRDLLDADALEEVERELRQRAPRRARGRAARPAAPRRRPRRGRARGARCRATPRSGRASCSATAARCACASAGEDG